MRLLRGAKSQYTRMCHDIGGKSRTVHTSTVILDIWNSNLVQYYEIVTIEYLVTI